MLGRLDRIQLRKTRIDQDCTRHAGPERHMDKDNTKTAARRNSRHLHR
jgi:hypothetical protein